MKVIIISTNAIGDAYLSMAAVDPLREKYPSAKFVFVFPEQSKLLDLENDENFTFLFTKKSLASLIKAMLKLISSKYDRVYSFFPGAFNSILFTVLRSEKKIGQTNFIIENRWDHKSASLVYKRKGSSGENYFKIEGDNFLSRIATSLEITDGITTGSKKYKPVSIGRTKCMKRIVIHYKASIPEKSLSFTYLIELIKLLKKNLSLSITLVGSNNDFEVVNKKALEKYSVGYLIDSDLKTLINQISTSYFIGVDSFPLHLADAYNTNFVGLFSRTKPKAVLINYEKSITFDVDSFTKVNLDEFIEGVTNYLGNNLIRSSEELK